MLIFSLFLNIKKAPVLLHDPLGSAALATPLPSFSKLPFFRNHYRRGNAVLFFSSSYFYTFFQGMSPWVGGKIDFMVIPGAPVALGLSEIESSSHS